MSVAKAKIKTVVVMVGWLVGSPRARLVELGLDLNLNLELELELGLGQRAPPSCRTPLRARAPGGGGGGAAPHNSASARFRPARRPRSCA